MASRLPRARRPWAAASLALVILLAAGCGGRDPIPASLVGRACATCGMEVRDPRYAAARLVDGKVRTFDSIECAIRDRSADAGVAGAANASARPDVFYAADFATGALHRADSLVVVRAPGSIPSPMGAGFAAFLDEGRARRIAAARNGTLLPAGTLFGATRVAP